MQIEKFKTWLNLQYGGVENTILTYLNHMKLFLKYSNGEINQEVIDEYLTYRLTDTIGEKISKRTYNGILNSFKVYFKFIGQEFKLPKNQRTQEIIKNYMTWEEVKKQVLPYTSLIFRDYKKVDLVLEFIYFTGMRIKEVAMLKKENINWKEEELHLIHTKGMKERIIPSIANGLFKKVKEYSDSHNSDLVFNISVGQIKNWFKEIKKQCGLKKFHPHLFRSFYANYCLEQGIDISIIQQLLGHSRIETTMKYVKPTQKMVREACKRIKEKK